MKGLEPNPCVVYLVWFTVSLCHGSLCAWRLTVLSLLRPDVALAFFLSSRPALPCPPASCPWYFSCSCCCSCLSCQTCILCAPALAPMFVMCAAFVVVLVPACNPVACCTCFCRRHVPALASAFVLRLLVSSSLYAVLPGTCLPLPARRGIRLYVSWVLHGDAIVPRLRRCWRLGESNYPYSPLAIPSQVNT